jgi:hypothetical protein
MLMGFDELIEPLPVDGHGRIAGSFTPENSFRSGWENGATCVNPHFGSRWIANQN